MQEGAHDAARDVAVGLLRIDQHVEPEPVTHGAEALGDQFRVTLRCAELREEFLGFIFVRFRPGGAGVAERFAPYRAEMEVYRTTEMVSRGTGWLCDIAVT